MQPDRKHPRALVGRTGHLLAVTAPSLGGRGTQFVAMAALASLVQPSEYGRFVVLQALLVGIASVLASTSAVAVNTATARIPGVRELPIRSLYTVMLRGRRWTFAAGALVSAALTPLGYALLTGTSIAPGEVALIAMLGALSGAIPLGDTLVAVISGSGRYTLGSSVDAGRAVVGAAATLVGAVTFGPLGGAAGLVVADALILTAFVVASVVRPAEPLPVRTTVSAREGLTAGIVANITGQITQWILLFGVQLVGGTTALGVYGAANRFASLVTLAPVYFGKTVIGQLADDATIERRWTPRSFLSVLGAISLLTAALAFGLLALGFPSLVATYDGLLTVTVALLAGTVLRALLIGVGHICVARRRWTTWVVADLSTLAATVLGTVLVLNTGGDVLGIIAVFAVGNLAGLIVRIIGSRRRPSRRTVLRTA